MISEEYFAGFFDGEGCINMTIRGKNRQCVLRLWLTNTDYEFLELIQREYGGRLIRRPAAKEGWKPNCNIVWQGRAAGDLVRRIGAKLILKARQARVALAFVEFQEKPPEERCVFIKSPCAEMPNRMIRSRSQETLRRELKFKDCLHQLNRKGAIALSEARKGKK